MLLYRIPLGSRIKLQKSNPDSCHTSFKFKTKEQLNQDFAILKKKFQEKEKEYRKIKNKFEESDLLSKSDDDDLRQILSCLNSGFSEMNKKLDSPKCFWADCNSSKFDSVSALIKHVFIDHIANQEQNDQPPIMKKYKCNWEKYTAGHFDKQDSLKNHVKKHTGEEKEFFLKLLLIDQAKALVTPSKQMRWHPMVIKFCLSNYTSERNHEQLRNSGFLKLTSGRLLRNYRHFDKQNSGWNIQNIEKITNLFEKNKYSLQCKIGALIFDEMKIKEGLVWTTESNEVVGFTDLGSNDVDGFESLASNILQFFFKSLFSDFSFPVAFIPVRNLNGIQVNNAFWEGVELLHSFRFITMLSICDGASKNRKVICSNVQSHPQHPLVSHMRINPYTNGPLYFMSDPPHLIKKNQK